MTKLLAAALLATLVFAACKEKDAAPPAAKATEAAKPVDTAAKPADITAKPAAATGGSVASYDDYKTKSLAYASKMIDVLKADVADCDKLATDVGAITTEPDFVAMISYEKSHDADRQKFDTENKAQEDVFMAAAKPVLAKCKDNKHVADVFSKF